MSSNHPQAAHYAVQVDLPICSCSFKDKEVQRDAKMVSYDVVDKKGKPNVQVEIAGEKKTFSPEEISAMILSKMKETAGALLTSCIYDTGTCYIHRNSFQQCSSMKSKQACKPMRIALQAPTLAHVT